MDENANFRSFEELDALADAGELSAEDLKMELANYTKAYRQEFETALTNAPDKRIESTREFFREHTSMAAAQIVFLATHSDKDSVQLAASKYIIDQANKDGDSGDEITDLLKALTKNDKVTDKASQ